MADLINSAIGSQGNAGIWATNEKPIDMHETLFKNHPSRYPIQAILASRMGEDDTSQSRIDWTEHEEIPLEVYQTAAAAAGTAGAVTAVTFANYTHLRNHDVVKNLRTGELMKVQDTSIDATVGMVKGWGSTTATASVAGDRYIIMSSAYHEAANEVNSRARANTNYYNLTQEIDEYAQTSTRVENEASHFGGKGSKREENIAKMIDAYRTKLEYAYMLSRRHSAASLQTSYTDYYVQSMDGIETRLTGGTNRFIVNGILTESKLDNYLADVWNSMGGQNENLIFVAGIKVIKNIVRMAKPNIRISPNNKKYGLWLNQYFGAVSMDLVPHPLLKGPVLEEWAFLLNLDYLKVKYQKRPMLTRDVGVKSANYKIDKMYGLVTMMLAEEKRHGFLTGITG